MAQKGIIRTKNRESDTKSCLRSDHFPLGAQIKIKMHQKPIPPTKIKNIYNININALHGSLTFELAIPTIFIFLIKMEWIWRLEYKFAPSVINSEVNVVNVNSISVELSILLPMSSYDQVKVSSPSIKLAKE